VHGGGYSFLGGKRDVNAAPRECEKVDTFFHEDGQQYDITSMYDAQFSELLALANDGTAPVDFPGVFKVLEKGA
jgi:hypothetical protein